MSNQDITTAGVAVIVIASICSIIGIEFAKK